MPARKSRLLLLVENRDLGEILKIALGDYDLELHSDRGRAEDAFRRRSFDIAIVDLSFGGSAGGLALIRTWRAAGGDFPVIAISDIPQPSLVVEALEAGADDFLRQPFHHQEMVVRLRKLLDRRRASDPVRKAGGVLVSREPFYFGGATVTPDLAVRFPNGEEERIGAKHHGILRTFSGRAGGLVLKEELVKAVWGSDTNQAGHSVNQYVSSLRRIFARHGIDFNRLVASEIKAGWRIHPAAAAGPTP